MSDIEFPSDKLTLQHLRGVFPGKFDQRDAHGLYGEFFEPPPPYPTAGHKEIPADSSMLLGELVDCERVVAEGVLARLSGFGDDALDHDRDEVARARLVVLYDRFRMRDVTGYDAVAAVAFIEAKAREAVDRARSPQADR